MKDIEKCYLKIKLEAGGIMPTRAHPEDAGMDVYMPTREFNPDISIVPAHEDLLIPLQWRCEFPKGYVMIFKEKSGVATKLKLDLGASVVDSNYRGIVHCHLFNNSQINVWLKPGQKIAQFIIVPCWTGLPEEVQELSESNRGEGGFGSSGLTYQGDDNA